MHARPLALVLGLSIAVLAPDPARAQPAAPAASPSPDAVKRADALYKQGVRLYSEKKWADALSAFREAWAINPTFDVAYNLGSAEYQLGACRDAAEHLAVAVRGWPLLTATSALRQTAQQRLDVCRAQVGALTVKVNVPRAEVMVDGKRVGQAPLEGEVFVTPGAHTVEVKLAGYEAASQKVDAAKGTGTEVTLVLKAEPAALPPSPPPPPPKRSVVPGVVLGSVAGAAAITGIGLFAAGRAKESSIRDLHDTILHAGQGCAPKAAKPDPRCAQLESAATQGNTLQRAGVGVLIGAGAVAVGTVIYFVLPRSSAGTPSTGTLRVTPALSPSTAGLVFSGTL